MDAPTTGANVPLGFPELWESLARARMDIAELKGMVKMHFADRAHHTPPCATASGLQKTLHAQWARQFCLCFPPLARLYLKS